MRLSDAPPVRALEGRRHLPHEPIHLLLNLRMRLQADVEVENYLGETGWLYFFQRVDNLTRRAHEDRVLGQIFGLHVAETVDHVDEVAVARRRSFRVAWQGRDHALAVVADLARPRRHFMLDAVGHMDEIAAHHATALVAKPAARLVVEVGDLSQT